MRHERPHDQVRLPVGRPLPAQRSADRRRAHDPRHRACLCAGKASAARDRRLSQRAHRSRDLPRNGRTRPARRDRARGIRRRRRELCQLWPGRARSRGGGLRLSLDDVGAILARHVSDLHLRLGRAAQEVPAEARLGRIHRLLRLDRAGRRLRSCGHEDACGKGRRRLSPRRFENVDFQRADRRRIRRLGEVRSPRRRDPRLRAGKGHEGAVRAEDRRQAQLARFHHRRDRDGRRRGSRKRALAERLGPQGSVRLPQPRPLRHFLGRDGRC